MDTDQSADTAVDHLLSKIDESSKRNNLSYYRDILFREFESKCFYCGKTVNLKHVAVDHFIPWSFIKDDNLWNFEEHGTTIGSKKIVVLEDVETDELKIHITSARDTVKMDWVKVY